MSECKMNIRKIDSVIGEYQVCAHNENVLCTGEYKEKKICPYWR